MTDSSAEQNPQSANPPSAPTGPAPKPAARPPIQVGARRHFTSRTGGIPWKKGDPESGDDSPGGPDATAPANPVSAAASVDSAAGPSAAASDDVASPSSLAPAAVEEVAASGDSTSSAPGLAPEAGPVGTSESTGPGSGAGAGSGAGERGRDERKGRREGSIKDRGKQKLQLPSTKDLMPRAVVPKPSRHDKLTPDIEEEMAEAFGNVTLDKALTGGYDLNASQELEELDAKRSAIVVRLHNDDVFFVLGGRNEGVASVRQFAKPPQPGDSFDVVVRGFNAEDGLYELAVPGASIDVSDWSDLREGAIVEAVVTAANTGGLECMVNKIRGFIPASQVSIYRVENLGEMVGQRMLCVVNEANAQRRNLVLSRRAMLEREKEESRKNFYANLEVGQVHEGVVRKIEDFGAFVDLGGGDGLIHVSQMSWERVKHPSEVVQIGQKVKVRVEKVDEQTGKIGLSLRSLQDDPWEGIEAKFPVGSVAQGKVSRLATFGAFVKLAMGVEGLIHVSELAHYRVREVKNVVSEGQDVEVKILTVDPEAQRIGLSLKATLAPPQVEKAADAEAAPDEPPPKSAVPKWTGNLKGGLNRPTGGEGIGLNW